MKVYVYKHHNNEDTYEKETISVYANKTDAEAALKQDIEKSYGLEWNEIPAEYCFNDRDIFEKDYVSIDDGRSRSFWIIEEKEVL